MNTLYEAIGDFCLPTVEIYERHRFSGLTRYERSEVESVMRACVEAKAQLDSVHQQIINVLRAACESARDALGEKEDGWGIWFYLPEPLQPLNTFVSNFDFPSIDAKGRGRTSNEMFPIATWRRQLASVRRAAKRLEKALAQATEEVPA